MGFVDQNKQKYTLDLNIAPSFSLNSWAHGLGV